MRAVPKPRRPRRPASSAPQWSRRASHAVAIATTFASGSPTSCGTSPRASLGASPRPLALGRLFLSTFLRRQQLCAHLFLDVCGHVRMRLQEQPCVVLALADALAVVAVPGTGLLDDTVGRAQLDDLPFARDARAVHDLELRLAERRGNLVLHDLDARLIADDFLAVLDRADATDIQPHRGVELQRVATGGGLGVAEHDAD